MREREGWSGGMKARDSEGRKARIRPEKGQREKEMKEKKSREWIRRKVRRMEERVAVFLGGVPFG